ncbi:DMT family transporter [Paracoccaceae bacterium]|nr:DMT family transporter [Paracoccaceae bacterium]
MRGKNLNKETVSSRDSYFLGALFLFLEIVVGTSIVAIIKYFSSDVALAIVLMFRYLFCLPILLIVGLTIGGVRYFKIKNKKIMTLRSVAGLFGLLFWYLSVIYLDISKALALSQVMPIFICLLSIMFLGEKVGVFRWTAILFGLSGAVIIINPESQNWYNLGLLYIFLGTLFASIMFVALRRLGMTENPVATAFWYNLFGSTVFSIYCLSALTVYAISFHIWVMLIIIGVMASAQQIFMALSHTYASASSLAPMHYTTIPIGIIIGLLVFNETIDLNFMIGTLFIVGSTLFILYREKKKSIG